ncbi:MAG: hypothetical protein RXQ68_02640 [Candidatus Nanopusillus sp.]
MVSLLEKILFPKQRFENTGNRVVYGIKNLGNRIGNIIREDLEIANKYVTNTGNKIKEKVETAKYIIPNALMRTLIFSNEYGRIAYYSAKAYIYYNMEKQAEKGKIYYGRSNIIVPIIAGSIGSVLGFGAAILLGSFHILNHQYQESLTDQQYQELQQQLQNLQSQDQNLQNQLKNLQNEYQGLEQQYQNLESELQNMNTLEETLFGNNPYDISAIQINSVQIENGIAYVQGTVSSSGANVILEIPVQYVEVYNPENNNYITIQDLVSAAQQNNWNAYILIDRADLQYMSLSSNQNNIPVISIQPNEPANIAVTASPANGSTLDDVLNNLGQYTMLIQDGNQDGYIVYGDPNALWGYLPSAPSSGGGSVVINFQNYGQEQEAETMINIADQVINSINNPNPTSTGLINTYSIFNGTISVYTGTSTPYPEYNVGQTYIPIIVLQSGQGNTIINSVSS